MEQRPKDIATIERECEACVDALWRACAGQFEYLILEPITKEGIRWPALPGTVEEFCERYPQEATGNIATWLRSLASARLPPD